MGRILLAVLIVVAGTTTGGTAQGPPTVQVVEVDADQIRYVYDPAKLKPYALNDLLQISPFSANMPPFLELCVQGDADYRPCGSRALGAENFLANANVNITKGTELLAALDRLNVPASLQPAFRYHRRGVVFWMCLERARFAYYRGDNNALRTTCDDVDASATCPDWLRQASAARSEADRDELAKSGWHNCMNDAFAAGYGKYPIDAWRAFLKQFAIQETTLTIP